MEAEGSSMLDRAGVNVGRRRFDRSVDARYAGQSYELNVPVASGTVDTAAIGGIAEAFHARHAQTYGHGQSRRDCPVRQPASRGRLESFPPLTIRQQPAAAGTPSREATPASLVPAAQARSRPRCTIVHAWPQELSCTAPLSSRASSRPF